MASRTLRFPFRLGAHGGVAVTRDPDRHLRDKIEASLFTAPGERVHDPDFGVGLDRALFEALDPLTAAALEHRVAQGLRRDLGSELALEEVEIEPRPDEGVAVLRILFRRLDEYALRQLDVVL